MQYLRVKNWEEYQHYKNRNPPWIKLHTKILNDRAFTALSQSSRGVLMQLWILASENEGIIPFDLEEIKFRLRDGGIKLEQIKQLIDLKFLKICKQTLADANTVQADASPETETETEGETEKKPPKSPFKIPDWVDPKLWRDFKEHRQKLRKPMTAKAESLLIGKLTKFREQGHNPTELLETAIERGWQSVFPKKKAEGESHPSFRVLGRTDDD